MFAGEFTFNPQFRSVLAPLLPETYTRDRMHCNHLILMPALRPFVHSGYYCHWQHRKPSQRRQITPKLGSTRHQRMFGCTWPRYNSIQACSIIHIHFHQLSAASWCLKCYKTRKPSLEVAPTTLATFSFMSPWNLTYNLDSLTWLTPCQGEQATQHAKYISPSHLLHTHTHLADCSTCTTTCMLHHNSVIYTFAVCTQNNSAMSHMI